MQARTKCDHSGRDSGLAAGTDAHSRLRKNGEGRGAEEGPCKVYSVKQLSSMGQLVRCRGGILQYLQCEAAEKYGTACKVHRRDPALCVCV